MKYIRTKTSEGHEVLVNMNNINFIGEYGNVYREIHFADGQSWVSVELTLEDFQDALVEDEDEEEDALSSEEDSSEEGTNDDDDVEVIPPENAS